jgi:hypothetical protein
VAIQALRANPVALAELAAALAEDNMRVREQLARVHLELAEAKDAAGRAALGDDW